MKCPGCTKPCEDCDKPIPVAEYQQQFPLSPWGYLEKLAESLATQGREIKELKQIIQERTADS